MRAPITLPADLVAEVAADQSRFKPEAPIGQQVLVLARFEGRGPGGLIGPVDDHFEGSAGKGVSVAAGPAEHNPLPATIQSALAWALVGTASDPTSPRPAVGDRVLVLAPTLVPVVGTAVSVPSFADSSFLVRVPNRFGDEEVIGATSWAIMPPAPETPVANANGAAALDEVRWDGAGHALRVLSASLLEQRDRLPRNRSLGQDGRRLGLEEAAVMARALADRIERGERDA